MFSCGLPLPLKDGSTFVKAEDWAIACHCLLKSMQHSLSFLLNGIDTEDSTRGTDTVPVAKDLRVTDVAQRFAQLCQNLITLLNQPKIAPVKLPLSGVMGVISRCLNVSYLDVKSIPSMSDLVAILPCVQQSALDILFQLIVSCRTQLLPQSIQMTELCLQTLTCTQHMTPAHKCATRASVYQAICLLVQTFGWGQYLTHQSQSLFQEIMADIRCQMAQTDANKKVTGLELLRKKPKKKRNKVESYGELTEAATIEAGQWNVQATFYALDLSRQALESVQFAVVENLIRCILDTTLLLQREGPAKTSPYWDSQCRKQLYSAVFACATVKLGLLASCRKDTVTHFQTINLAMSLLTNGCQEDLSHEVKLVCRQALNSFRLNGNLQRPIVRRKVPHDHDEARDMEKEEKLMVENESLKKQLLDSKVENEKQTDLIANLREELEQLKADSCAWQVSGVLSHSFMTGGSTVEYGDSAVEEEQKMGELDRQSSEPEKHWSSGRTQPNMSAISGKAEMYRQETEQSQRKRPASPGLETARERKVFKVTVSPHVACASSISQSASLQAMIADFVPAEPDPLDNSC